MVEFIRSNFPDAIASPAQKSSRSFDLSSSVGVTDPKTPSGSLLGWSQVMSDSFVDTQKKFSKRIQEGRACHTLLPSLHGLEKVANSPSQGKELTANPDVLDLLKNKVPDFRHLPISVKEGMALERTLRSIMESQSFLTWSVMGLMKSHHLKNLLPKDDPVISQMQKSFSKACNNVASGMTAGAAFLTMKRRQLLLSHVVPSVSEAQKRNLLADPFFQTSSLFDASSLERRLRQGICPYSNPTSKPRPLHHKVDDRDLTLHQAAEVLLGSTLVRRHHSAHPPLSDSSLLRREMPASIRSLPEPLRSGGVFGSRSLVPHRWLAAA